MKKGDIVLHEGVEVKIVRGAPVRYGKRRAVVERLVDGQSYAVSLRRLTPLALDGAIALDNQQVFPADVPADEGILPVRPASNANRWAGPGLAPT
jgi:hypothetical protein